MRLPLAIAAILLSAAPLTAQVAKPHDINVGRGIICDTPEQAQRFVKLRYGGTETVAALESINKDANTRACGNAMVAFRVEPVQSASAEGQRVDVVADIVVDVVKITVIAFSDGQTWSTVPETVQYAVVLRRGIDV